MLRTAALCALAVSAAAFAPTMPLAASSSCGNNVLPLAPSSRASARAVAPKMAMDSSILPGVIAGAAGLGISVGALWWTEQRAVSSIEKLSEDQMTKLAAKMDGGDAENKFSGSDQNLDSLIAGMETAQGVKSEKKEKVVVEEDDGW